MQWYQAWLDQPVIKIPELIPKILHRKSWLKAILLTIMLEFPVLSAIPWPPCQLIHGKSASTLKEQPWKSSATRKFPSPRTCSEPCPGCSRPSTWAGPGELFVLPIRHLTCLPLQLCEPHLCQPRLHCRAKSLSLVTLVWSASYRWLRQFFSLLYIFRFFLLSLIRIFHDLSHTTTPKPHSLYFPLTLHQNKQAKSLRSGVIWALGQKILLQS